MKLTIVCASNTIVISLFCLLFQIPISSANGRPVEDQLDAIEYLARFGYVEPDIVNDMNLVDARPYLKEFQKMMGIEQTGDLDEETMKMMNSKRCGNTDLEKPMHPGESSRPRRFSANGRRWGKRELTYKISRYSEDMNLDKVAVEKDLEKAFSLWENATNLIFIKASPNQHADIDIQFSTKKHSDSFPFDGPGTTLAHAFGPGSGLGGDVHFDDHEQWSIDSPKGVNVLFVAVHEIGHSMGLSHSLVKGSIMRAAYPGYIENLQLHQDDIAGIQSLYGARAENAPSTPPPPPATETTRKKITTIRPRVRTSTTFPTPSVTEESDLGVRLGRPRPNPTTAPSPTPTPRTDLLRADLCADPKIDAAFSAGGQINIFKGKYAYGLDTEGRSGVIRGPTRIEFKYSGLVPPVDACFTRKSTGFTYCFKNDEYYRFLGTKLSPDYPKSISVNFPGIPDNIDAAFEWPENEKFYFFKGDKYWAFDSKKPKGRFVDAKYPLPIENLGLNNVDSIDAAFVHPTNGRTYLFKNEWYWRLQDKKLKVAQADPPYPRQSRLMWFKCTSYTPELESI